MEISRTKYRSFIRGKGNLRRRFLLRKIKAITNSQSRKYNSEGLSQYRKATFNFVKNHGDYIRWKMLGQQELKLNLRKLVSLNTWIYNGTL